MLAVLSEIEAEGALGPAIAERAARRRMAGLPQTFQHEDTARLLGDLALALAAVRKLLPADLPAEAAEPWLDAQAPGWRDSLPLRLNAEPRLEQDLSQESLTLSKAGRFDSRLYSTPGVAEGI